MELAAVHLLASTFTDWVEAGQSRIPKELSLSSYCSMSTCLERPLGSLYQRSRDPTDRANKFNKFEAFCDSPPNLWFGWGTNSTEPCCLIRVWFLDEWWLRFSLGEVVSKSASQWDAVNHQDQCFWLTGS